MEYFTEATLEHMLFKNPSQLCIGWNGRPVERWLARQYAVPSGIIDLLGIVRDENNRPIPVVVELKNRPLKSEDIAQVLRYSADINEILLCLAVGKLISQIDDAIMVLIGRGAPLNKVLFEANAANVYVHSFEINQTLEVSGHYFWEKDFEDSNYNKIYCSAKSKIFEVFLEQE